jgi:hypothetical protein
MAESRSEALCRNCGKVESAHVGESQWCKRNFLTFQPEAAASVPRAETGAKLGRIMQYLNDQQPKNWDAVELLSRTWANGFREYVSSGQPDQATTGLVMPTDILKCPCGMPLVMLNDHVHCSAEPYARDAEPDQAFMSARQFWQTGYGLPVRSNDDAQQYQLLFRFAEAYARAALAHKTKTLEP